MQSMVLDTKEDSDNSTLGLEEYHFHHLKIPKYHSSISFPIPWHQLSCVTDPQGFLWLKMQHLRHELSR
ncbi:hypothetical protein QQP08_005191 [Theobroma cacao]|nr:hypothetical protein QQP08_005191 [Theobroma cacao]